ncbi:hypothetical protein WKW80_09240 [Variovorax humicola]|uniref:Uncharacterized protein n=1 Tax=Variovorax humicola TaxID=1769758 RepID=A0ABU8VWP2_9BURK
MDSDTVKLVISVVSALVAVISAVLANRTRVQARSDLFENQRDSLVLAMADNDNRIAYLVLSAGALRQQISDLLEQANSDDIAEANRLMKNLAEIAAAAQALARREYSEESLERIAYSEESIQLLRRNARSEQIIAKSLRNEGYGLVFDYAKNVIAKLSPRR